MATHYGKEFPTFDKAQLLADYFAGLHNRLSHVEMYEVRHTLTCVLYHFDPEAAIEEG